MCVFCGLPTCSFEAPSQAASDISNAVIVSAVGTVIPTVSDAAAIQLSYLWTVSELTYGFPDSASDYVSGSTYYGEEDYYLPLGENGHDMIAAAAASWGAVSGLSFTLAADGASADIRVSGSELVGTAWAYTPEFPGSAAGDIWVGSDKSYNSLYNSASGTVYVGSYEYYVALHEFGHSLGLKHPHQAYGSSTLVMSTEVDSIEYSVMSYRSYLGAGTGGLTVSSGNYPQSLMMLDLAAIQSMYGANYSTLSGDTVYRFDPSDGEMFVDGGGTGATVKNVVFRTLWDGNGHDTIDLSAYVTDVAADLAPGGAILFDATGTLQRARLGQDTDGYIYAVGNVFMSLLYNGDTRSLIEDIVTGSGDDSLYGNVADNRFDAGSGDDVIDGLSGTDTAVVHGTAAAVTAALSGTSLVLSTAGGTLTLSNVETLEFDDATVATLTLTTLLSGDAALAGQSVATLLGMAQTTPQDSDSLISSFLLQGMVLVEGTSGDDVLEGSNVAAVLSGGEGNDRLWARTSDDVLVGDAGGDAFVFDLRSAAATGTDLILDLDFSEGDVIKVLTTNSGLFSQDPDPDNTMRVSSDGSTIQIRSLADLAEAVAFDAIDAVDGTYGLVLNIPDVAAGMQLEIKDIWLADLDFSFLAGGQSSSGTAPGTDTDTDTGTGIDAIAQTYIDAGWSLIQGSDADDIFKDFTEQSVFLLEDGDDKIFLGSADQVVSGGAGADRFVIDLRSGDTGAAVLVTDLDFAAGDWLNILTRQDGTFTDDAVPGNDLWVNGSGDTANPQSLADLAELVLSGALTAWDGNHGLVLAVDAIAPNTTVELAGIWLDDLQLA